MPEVVRISVRSLVEYAYRRGDIETGFRSPVALAEGSRIHRQVQGGYGENDRKEVFLSSEIPYGDLLFVLEGRCDGLRKDGDRIVVEEIKSTVLDPKTIDERQYPVHWAQAMCYAYLYSKEIGIPKIRIRLTYVHVERGETVAFEREEEFAELERAVMASIEAYAPYARMSLRNARLRDESIARLAFPFAAYRPGQRKLAGAVYKSLEEGVGLFAQAPTGIGKTVSVLFPAVKAIGQGHIRRLFYLTAKTTNRTAAEDTLALLRDGGLHLPAVTLTAKEKICFREEVRCSKEFCEFADGYYDRINGALLDMLANETLMTRLVIERYARKHRVCPFEFSLDAAYAADAVICDYNYVFDPRVSLKRLSGEQKKQTALLADEAHNLVDRAREMFSAELRKSDFLAIQREYKGVNPGVFQAAKAINGHFIALRKEGEDRHRVWKEAPETLLQLAEAFAGQAELVLQRAESAPQPLLDAYYAVQAFVRIGSLYDERFATYAEFSKNDVRLKLFCLDPSHLLRQTAQGFRSRVYFSATLTPAAYFKDMLGAEPEDYGLAVPSPFAKEQWEVSVVPLSTRYADRERSVQPLVRLLRELLEERPGKYLFFFPSYEYMNAVYEGFVAEGTQAIALLQHPTMAEEEKARFLSAYAEEQSGPLAGFAVLGGVFSEGIDLAGDRLNGVVVVGVGLPQVGPERETLKRYFDETGRNGFDYAYVYPGMNKVQQAGGRLIRSETDKGVLVLVDDRYRQARYRRLLPDEWKTE
ncbi:ATP-dependent DNA helicase [Cohnella sp. CFH 77786]|uniref:ATP-dependent DNA helicase n=1 Tax=Cohnella sp. CFH 77786 TaxID=2662265 RepID=UPI001C608335|nr:ATP-dependent DNA helicase [Cohnella sp. CFH 77786]MBW5446020.1 ATP-dependent DNA helicase [Cohnella sp. CFH 77786]